MKICWHQCGYKRRGLSEASMPLSSGLYINQLLNVGRAFGGKGEVEFPTIFPERIFIRVALFSSPALFLLREVGGVRWVWPNPDRTSDDEDLKQTSPPTSKHRIFHRWDPVSDRVLIRSKKSVNRVPPNFLKF